MKRNLLSKFLLSLLCTGCTLPMMGQNPTNCYEESSWNFAVDFLYWSTDFHALGAIAVELETTDDTADAMIQIKHPSQSWDPGVRLTGGWVCANNWDISGSWTYFYNRNVNSITPFQLQVNMDSLDTSGGSRHTFRYNAADLTIGTALPLTSFLLIHPLMGIEAIWLNTVSQLNIIAPPSSGPDLDTDGFTVDINLNKRAWGIGPKLGVNTLWGNFKGCSLVANVNGSLLYGEQRATLDAEIDITSDVDINILLMGDSFWQLMSMIQIQSGFSYLGCLCNHEFRLNVLWECNMFNQANNILIFDRSISTQGLTVSLEYPF